MTIINETKFVIYGAGEMGIKLSELLKKRGFEILFFIDGKKKTGEIVNEIAVYNIKDFPSETLQSSSIPVIISLSNGMLHQEVAEMLYLNGATYIVFIPFGFSVPENAKTSLLHLYNSFLGTSDLIGLHIEEYVTYIGSHLTEDSAILSREDEIVIAWVPAELISTEIYSQGFSNLQSFYDQLILRNNTIEKLFISFSEGNIDLDIYFLYKENELSTQQKLKTIQNRLVQFSQFMSELNDGMNFFIQSATNAGLNKKGYFNLINGHHRTMFLTSKNIRLVPLRLTKSDFEKWTNRVALDSFVSLINKENICETEYPILHPAFTNFKAKNSWCCNNLLRKMFSIMDRFSNIQSIFDFSNSNLYFTYIFSKTYNASITYSSKCKDSFDFNNKLLELYRAKSINLTFHNPKEMIIENKHDVVIALDGIFDNNKERCIDSIREIAAITNKVLFVETPVTMSDEDISTVIKTINFNKYEKLMTKVNDNNFIEVGAFIKY